MNVLSGLTVMSVNFPFWKGRQLPYPLQLCCSYTAPRNALLNDITAKFMSVGHLISEKQVRSATHFSSLLEILTNTGVGWKTKKDKTGWELTWKQGNCACAYLNVTD